MRDEEGVACELLVNSLCPDSSPAIHHVSPVVQEGNRSPDHHIGHVAESIEVDSHQVVQGHLDEVTLLPVFHKNLNQQLRNMVSHATSVIISIHC